MNIKTVLIRVDASAIVGSGHLIRCKSLAMKFLDSGVGVIFAIKTSDAKLLSNLKMIGFIVEVIPAQYSFEEDANLTAELAKRHNSNLIITDICSDSNVKNSKNFKKYFLKLNQYNLNIAVIDDLEKIDLPFNLQIIPYFGADKINYNLHPNTRYLLGEKYFIAPTSLGGNFKKKVIQNKIKNILISLGGSDKDDLTIFALKALEGDSRFEVQVVIGPYFNNKAKEYLNDNVNSKSWTIYPKENLCDGLIWADLAIIGLGLTRYEAAICGVPNISITREKLEKYNNDALITSGIGEYISIIGDDKTDLLNTINKLDIEVQLREKISRDGQALIDGLGANRILQEVQKLNLL